MNSALTKYYFVIILISTLLAFFLTISPGFIFCIFLMACLFYMTLTNSPTEDRHFVLKIMLVALFLRLIVFIILQYYCFSKGLLDIFGDAEDNIIRGGFVVDYLMGVSDKIPPPLGSYNMHGLTYFNAIFFSLFGKDAISLKFINFLSILLAAWLIYDLTRRIYSSQAAKIAMAIILFWPPLFCWSLADLKESHVILAITLILWGVDKAVLKKGLRERLPFVLLSIISSFYLVTLRTMQQVLLVYFVITLTYFIFKWYVGRSNYKNIRVFLFIFLLCFVLLLFKEKIFSTAKEAYGIIIGLNVGYSGGGRSSYDLLSNIKNFYTAKFFLKFLFTTIFYFLFGPLPWNVASITMAIFYPLVFFWYLILFAAFIGFLKICKIGLLDRIFSPLVFLVLYVVGFGMSVANIGTAVRFRDSLIPILAMLSSCGLTSLPRNRSNN